MWVNLRLFLFTRKKIERGTIYNDGINYIIGKNKRISYCLVVRLPCNPPGFENTSYAGIPCFSK
jgi:hypothetical protein